MFCDNADSNFRRENFQVFFVSIRIKVVILMVVLRLGKSILALQPIRQIYADKALCQIILETGIEKGESEVPRTLPSS